MKNTINYGLNKPAVKDEYNVSKYNKNMDIIDAEINRIYRVEEIIEPKQNKIYNVFTDVAIDSINGRPICKENTNTPVKIKANKVSTLYYNGTYFFYKASATGDAIAENVLANKKFSNENDIDIIGTMPNNGDWSVTPTKEDIIIPKGYHSGGGRISGDSNLVPENIIKGKSIFGVSGNMEYINRDQKQKLVSAISNKGVHTNIDDSMDKIITNINNIRHKTLQSITKRETINVTLRFDANDILRRYVRYIGSYYRYGITSAVFTNSTRTVHETNISLDGNTVNIIYFIDKTNHVGFIEDNITVQIDIQYNTREYV